MKTGKNEIEKMGLLMERDEKRNEELGELLSSDILTKKQYRRFVKKREEELVEFMLAWYDAVYEVRPSHKKDDELIYLMIQAVMNEEILNSILKEGSGLFHSLEEKEIREIADYFRDLFELKEVKICEKAQMQECEKKSQNVSCIMEWLKQTLWEEECRLFKNWLVTSIQSRDYHASAFVNKAEIVDEEMKLMFLTHFVDIIFHKMLKKIRNETPDESENQLILSLKKELKELNEKCKELDILLKKENSKRKETEHLFENYKKQTISKKMEKKEICYNAENSQLKKRIQEMEKENSEYFKEMEELKKENECLYERIEKMMETEENGSVIDYQKKYLFLGGVHNTVIKLKKLFPNSKFIEEKTYNASLEELKNLDAVIYLTNFISHSLYYSLRNVCSKNGVKQIHITQTSVPFILEKLAEEIS